MDNPQPARYLATRRITLIGGVLNLLLGAVKVFVGTIAHSRGLVADGIHSFSDLLSDVLVLIAARYGSRDADEAHPYGHGRIETVAAVVVAAFLVSAGFAIGWSAVVYLHRVHVPEVPGLLALWIALLSIVVKELMYHATMRVATQWHSHMLMANAWHHRSDAASSLVVVIGLIASYFGYPMVDAIAAIVVAIKIAYMGGDIVWKSVRELVDTGLDEIELVEIRNRIAEVPGVRAIHQLRTRLMGGEVLLDVHIIVDSYVSVSEGHHVGEQVHLSLINHFSKIKDITVHVDPEDDEVCAPSAHLPMRDEIIAQCKTRWQTIEGADRVNNVVLHYVAGKIHLEVWVTPVDSMNLADMKKLSERFQTALADLSEVASVRVLFHNEN